MIHLTVTDLFMVGVGMDIAGAYLLARGLLLSDRELKRFGTWGGIGAADVVDRVRNRVDGWFGVSLLLAGFAVQFVGYVLELEGAHQHPGTGRLVSAVLIAAVAIGVSLLAWRALREGLVCRDLIHVALVDLDGTEGDGWTPSKVKTLVLYGKADARPSLPYESNESYVRRVFGVVVEYEQA